MVDILKLRKMGKMSAERGAAASTSISNEQTKDVLAKMAAAIKTGPGLQKPEGKVTGSEAAPQRLNQSFKPAQSGLDTTLDDADETVRRDLVVFSIGNSLYALDITEVQEVVRISEITRVPNAAAFVLGVMNLRGKITPVIDLHSRFGSEKSIWTEKTRIIVVRINDEVIGFLADNVSEIVHVRESSIETAASLSQDIAGDYVKGVVKISNNATSADISKILILLSLENVLEDTTTVQENRETS